MRQRTACTPSRPSCSPPSSEPSAPSRAALARLFFCFRKGSFDGDDLCNMGFAAAPPTAADPALSRRSSRLRQQPSRNGFLKHESHPVDAHLCKMVFAAVPLTVAHSTRSGHNNRSQERCRMALFLFCESLSAAHDLCNLGFVSVWLTATPAAPQCADRARR